MAKIEMLPKNVYNQISAGEVVEKPASIVKELVENSIDAKAQNITIEICGGGSEYISITDDGIGIASEDVELAFMPHATSKIRTFEDLSTLSSMGFRGEALASISAVSKVEMITKTSEQELATKIKLEGGDTISKTEVASVTGTKIIVKDLFFNTPARAKFLRKPKTEEGDITTYVEKLMLSHTNINFRYIVDGEIKYNTTNCGLLDIIYSIYGKEVAQNVLEVSYSFDNYKVSGYISKPAIAKSNRTYQSLFVNKRFCQNSTIGSAIAKVYEEFLMKGKFPLYVLFLDLPQDSVDVNVHPNKLEVKFENPNKIFMLFSNAISSTLYANNHLRVAEENEFAKTEEFVLSKLDNFEGVSFDTKQDIPQSAVETKIEDLSFNFTSSKPTTGFVFNEQAPKIVEISSTKTEEVSYAEQTKQENEELQQSYENLFNPNRNIIGVAFKTYIIVEEGDKLYFIDQHAAHERQLFDKFQTQIAQSQIIKQDLLIPYVLNVNNSEAMFLDNNLELLNEYGFDITEFGENCYKITSIPLLLDGINIKTYFDEILSNLTSLAKKPQEVLRNDIATIACKSAVKAGHSLSEKEINILLDTLEKEKTTLLCPHGRPIVIVYDKKQIEKMFKRIV